MAKTKVPENPAMEKQVEAVKLLFQLAGDNPERDGLRETPVRFLKAWEFWMSK